MQSQRKDRGGFKMKKIISIVLLFSMITSLCTVFAETNNGSVAPIEIKGEVVVEKSKPATIPKETKLVM